MSLKTEFKHLYRRWCYVHSKYQPDSIIFSTIFAQKTLFFACFLTFFRLYFVGIKFRDKFLNSNESKLIMRDKVLNLNSKPMNASFEIVIHIF